MRVLSSAPHNNWPDWAVLAANQPSLLIPPSQELLAFLAKLGSLQKLGS